MPESPSTRRDFLAASTTALAALSLAPAVHAAGSDVLRIGLIGCGGRGTGAIENICEAAGTSYNIKIHALGDAFEDRPGHVPSVVGERQADERATRRRVRMRAPLAREIGQEQQAVAAGRDLGGGRDQVPELDARRQRVAEPAQAAGR